MAFDVIHRDDYGDPDAPHSRIRWTPGSEDLHVNLVDLRAGEEIGEHVNTALDVLLTCLGGRGSLVVDGEAIEMSAGSLALIPRGARRAVIAGEAGMRYTTCHRKRGGLMPTVSRRA
jgi:quercetin dioxygenase-like cupin family protein